MAHPRSTARTLAFRAVAPARVSRTRTADPSPRFRPLRFWSKGEQGFGSNACRELNPLNVNGHSGSLPPARIIGRGSVEQHVGGERDRHRLRMHKPRRWHSAVRESRNVSPTASATCANGYEAAPQQTAGAPIPSGRIFGDSGVDLGQAPDRVRHHDAALTEGRAIATRIRHCILSRHHRELIGARVLGTGVLPPEAANPRTWAIVPSKPGYTSFRGRQTALAR